MLTCTWAPTVFTGPQIVSGRTDPAQDPTKIPTGAALHRATLDNVRRIEELGISHLLIAQRWWGSGRDIESSSLDCLAMTAYFAAITQRLHLVTAIHPGFFEPGPIAKWGTTMDQMTGGRWSINVTSGWNLTEFEMYGIDALEHDTRYARASEFIEVLRGAWKQTPFSYAGHYYQTQRLALEPRPTHPLQVFQGGQSAAAQAMAAQHADWMFLNGGAPAKLQGIVESAQAKAAAQHRQLQFAAYAAPLCRPTDDEAWAEVDAMVARINPELLAQRRKRLGGATGMWGVDSETGEEDPLRHLDTNEGYCTRLIGSPATVLQKVCELQEIGINMLHLDLRDQLFVEQVLPQLHKL